MTASPRIIKKYPNRRLYDTESSAYLTLDALRELIVTGLAVQVLDAKTGADISAPVFMQVLQEQMACVAERDAVQPLLAAPLLAEMIRVHGTVNHAVLAGYLDHNMRIFKALQVKIYDLMDAHSVHQAHDLQRAWLDFFALQAPTMQGMLNRYLEQSASLFMEMQQLNPPLATDSSTNI